jgi:hypothetical protein
MFQGGKLHDANGELKKSKKALSWRAVIPRHGELRGLEIKSRLKVSW